MATVPLLTIALIHGAILARQNRTAAENELTQTVQSIAQRVRTHVVQHRQAIVALAGLLETNRDLAAHQVELSLAVTHAAYPGFIAVLTADRDGRLTNTHPARNSAGQLIAAVTPGIADRDYFRQTLATGRPFVSQSLRERGFGADPTVAIGAPVRDASGAFAGVVAGSLDLSRLRQLCTAADSAQPMDLVVLDSRRHIVFSNAPSRYPSLSIPADPLFHSIPDHADASAPVSQRAPIPDDPVTRLVARYDFIISDDAPPWTAYALQDTAVADAGTLNYGQHTALAALGVALAALLLGRRVAAHLDALADLATETRLAARRGAEAEIASYRDRLELALAAANTCTWDNNLEQNRLSLDARWSLMLGGPAEPTALPGNQIFHRVHFADLRPALRQVRRCLDGPSSEFRSEQRVRNHRGEWIWVLSSGRVVERNAAGRATRIIGTNTDITARKHAETQLLRQKEFFATLQQTTLDLLARRELKDVFQTLIGHATALLHAPFGELLLREGEHLVTCAHTHGAAFAGPLRLSPADAPLFRRALDSHEPISLEDYAPSPDLTRHAGTTSPHAVVIVPILLDGASVGVLALGRHEPGATFTAEDRAHCTLLAQMAALVLHHAGIRETALREAAGRTVALRESEARARALFDQSPVINILSSLPEGILIEFNAAGLSTFGYTRDQVIGKTSPEIGLWADPAERLRYLDTLRTTGSVRNFEARMRRRDGTEFSVLCHGCLLTIGSQPYSLNTLEDITDRKRGEEAVRESAERFRNIFDHSPVPIALSEFPSGRIVAANDAVVAIWRRPRSEILGHSAIELGLWADLGERAKLHELMRRDGTVHNFETHFCHPDGRRATVLFSASLVTIAGRPYSLNTLLDITERKASELARDASLALLRATLESTADGILVVNADGRIATFNGIFAGMWHLPSGPAATDRDPIPELIRRQLVEPEKLPANLGELPPDSTGEVLATLTCRDGRIYECYSRPQLIGDQPSGRVWSFRDITARRRAEEERHKLEAQLRHTQKMESLGTLAGGIAHDFNNILTGILGFSDLARLSLAPGHAAHECLDHVLRSGHRARELVRQILTFSRASANERIPHRLHHEVAEALQLLRSTLPAMVELDRHIDSRTPPVLADATQIHQVVMNLCTNAWHALPPRGGRITVTLASHTVTPAEAAQHRDLSPGPYVRLAVADTGSGMSPATLEHIFEPFFTTKEVGKGTGLGLAVVHGVVQSHQGAIVAQSTLGVGTTFQLYFPALVLPDAPVAPADLAPIPRGHGERILVVDDDPEVGLALERLLATLGYKLLRLLSPTRALQLFTAQPREFALALVDLAMPEMAGDTLAESLLAVRPDLPVVMLTGYVEPERQAAILSSGVREVLRKPPETAELACALARHLAADTPGP